MTQRTVSAGQRVLARARGTATSSTSTISTPPIVGVPCLIRWPVGPLLADVLAELLAAQEVDELRADDDREDHREDPLRSRVPLAADLPASGPPRPARARPTGTPSRARRRPGGPARERCVPPLRCRVGDPRAAVAARELPDREHDVDAGSPPARRPAVVGGRVGPSSAISPSTATLRRRCAARCSSAARIETGLALYASLMSSPSPGSGDSSPRQRENATSTRPWGTRQPERL